MLKYIRNTQEDYRVLSSDIGDKSNRIYPCSLCATWQRRRRLKVWLENLRKKNSRLTLYEIKEGSYKAYTYSFKHPYYLRHTNLINKLQELYLQDKVTHPKCAACGILFGEEHLSSPIHSPLGYLCSDCYNHYEARRWKMMNQPSYEEDDKEAEDIEDSGDEVIMPSRWGKGSSPSFRGPD